MEDPGEWKNEQRTEQRKERSQIYGVWLRLEKGALWERKETEAEAESTRKGQG